MQIQDLILKAAIKGDFGAVKAASSIMGRVCLKDLPTETVQFIGRLISEEEKRITKGEKNEYIPTD